MNDDEYLENRRKDLRRSIEFFSSEHKIDREKWVVSTFLKNLGIPFSDTELRPPANDPPDIQFREAKFEIKELLDPGRQRHREFKEALKIANTTTDPAALLEEYIPLDIKLAELYEKLLNNTNELTNKYAPAVCHDLDLLYYVNLNDVEDLIEEPFPDTKALISQPWRSVSFVMGFRACVLSAKQNAPIFLARKLGKVIHQQGLA